MQKTGPALGALLLAALVASGCSRPEPSSAPEAVVEAAYEAIRDNDWQAYAQLTVTSADFILKEHNAKSPFKEKQSYVGTQLKPEEQARQKRDFSRAVAGGPGLIDFKQHEFGAAHLAAEGMQETLSGSLIPISSYLVATEGASTPAGEGPGFVVVKWGSFYRLLGLSFPSDFGDQGDLADEGDSGHEADPAGEAMVAEDEESDSPVQGYEDSSGASR